MSPDINGEEDRDHKQDDLSARSSKWPESVLTKAVTLPESETRGLPAEIPDALGWGEITRVCEKRVRARGRKKERKNSR